MEPIMPKRRMRYRSKAFTTQSGLCFYCGLPMWQVEASELAVDKLLTPHLAERLRCTAEHLRALQDGGMDRLENIVAAHKYCNEARHRWPMAPDPVEHRQRMRNSSNWEHWHPAAILTANSSAPGKP